jgi:hypothetical protein
VLTWEEKWRFTLMVWTIKKAAEETHLGHRVRPVYIYERFIDLLLDFRRPTAVPAVSEMDTSAGEGHDGAVTVVPPLYKDGEQEAFEIIVCHCEILVRDSNDPFTLEQVHRSCCGRVLPPDIITVVMAYFNPYWWPIR